MMYSLVILLLFVLSMQSGVCSGQDLMDSEGDTYVLEPSVLLKKIFGPYADLVDSGDKDAFLKDLGSNVQKKVSVFEKGPRAIYEYFPHIWSTAQGWASAKGLMLWVKDLQEDIIDTIKNLEVQDDESAIQKHFQSFAFVEKRDEFDACDEVQTLEREGAKELYEIFKMQRAHSIFYRIIEYQEAARVSDDSKKFFESAEGFDDFCGQFVLVESPHEQCKESIEDARQFVWRKDEYSKFQFCWFPSWIRPVLSVLEWFEGLRQGCMIADIAYSHKPKVSVTGYPDFVWFRCTEEVGVFSELWKSVSGVSAVEGMQGIINNMWSYIFALNTAEDKSRAFFVTALFFNSFASCGSLGYASSADEFITNLCAVRWDLTEQSIVQVEQFGGYFDSTAARADISQENAYGESFELIYKIKRKQSAHDWLHTWVAQYVVPILKISLYSAQDSLGREWHPPSLTNVSANWALSLFLWVSNAYGVDWKVVENLGWYNRSFCGKVGVHVNSFLFLDYLKSDRSVWVYPWDMPYPDMSVDHKHGVCKIVLCLPSHFPFLGREQDLSKISAMIEPILMHLNMFYREMHKDTV